MAFAVRACPRDGDEVVAHRPIISS
jgi:hypothetical protein